MTTRLLATRYPCCNRHVRVPADELHAGVTFDRHCQPCRKQWTVNIEAAHVDGRIKGVRIVAARWTQKSPRPKAGTETQTESAG